MRPSNPSETNRKEGKQREATDDIAKTSWNENGKQREATGSNGANRNNKQKQRHNEDNMEQQLHQQQLLKNRSG